MTPVFLLWLPILLSAVIVFVVSSIIHMATPWHKSDYSTVPDEDRLMDALRPFAVPPGDYMIPRPATTEEMRTPAFKEKVRRGPVVIATFLPNGMMTMGKSLVLWFVYCVVVGLFAAYVAGSALPPGAHYLKVFQLVGATAFAGYALAQWPFSIWYRRSWITTIKGSIDGLIFALLTAGTTGWLWPR
jgi:hypothetical protein